MIHDLMTYALLVSAAAGCAFMLIATAITPSLARIGPVVLSPAPAVTVLKPLYGEEEGLFENLAGLCEQDYAGTVQIVVGVAEANDPALAVVERLRGKYPDVRLDVVVDGRTVGANPKVSNLGNMSARIAHEIVIVSDSDIRVRRDYLAQVVDGLQRSRGAVTCPYYGISTGSFWSRLAQMTIDGQFLPGVLVGAKFGIAQPCLGSTIALRRDLLAAIGGFEVVADCLADDYELGVLLAKHGAPVTVLPLAVGHVCDEISLSELWHHELRWALTIRTIDPIAYAGWFVTHAFAAAAIAWCIGGGSTAVVLAVAALVCRAVLILAIERGYGLQPHPYWLIPVRELLSFAVYIAGFVTRDVSWRGQRLRLKSKGTLGSEERLPSS
jgi:ceramide glucosyltransferase